MQSWQLIRLPTLDIQSRDARIVVFGAATFSAGFLAGYLWSRPPRIVTTRDAAVNTAAVQHLANGSLANGHVSGSDTASELATPRTVAADSRPTTPRAGSCKLLIIVRTDLLTGTSKLTIQCSQAAIGWYKRLYMKNYVKMQEWEKEGSQRVCYAAANDEQFAFVRKLAREAKLATYAVVEKGQTDVQTVMAVGPVPADLLIKMTSSLHAPIQAHRLS